MNAVKKQEKKFPYQIHLIFGLIWIVVGLAFYSGTGSVLWVGGGLIMIIIGILNRRKS